MKILITGINGFVGTNLVQAVRLKQGIHGLDINTELQEGVKHVYRWDEFDQLPQVEIIIHLAGKAHDLKNISDEQEYFSVNAGLTRKIFDHFKASCARKFIFISSVKAVADSFPIGELTEDVIPSPVTAYGRSKLEAEKYILQYGPQADKKVYILRPCMIHGQGNKGNLNLLYKLVSKGIPWPLGAFENKRSFCSIGNISFIIEELIERSDIPSGIYNVADDEPISTVELIRLMGTALKKNGKIMNLPEGLIRSFARTGDLLRLPLNTERLQKLTESYVVSNARIKQAIGKPLPLSARDGLIHTFRSFDQ